MRKYWIFALLTLMTVLIPHNSFAFTGATSTVTGASLTPGPIHFPEGFMKSIKDYGAVGDGKTDDTKAIQAALAEGRSSATKDYFGLPKALYFPPGIYLVRDTLTWNGCCVTIQGGGTSASVIRLAPSSPGFSNPGTPKSVVMTAATNTNESFRQNIWDIGIKVGPDNPGAIGISYVSNNFGSIHDVSILSEDGQGVVGVDLSRHYPGPLMMKNLLIDGFDTGMNNCRCYEYSATIEGLTLKNQRLEGIYDWRQTMNIRNFKSVNKVPALINEGALSVVIDASFEGGVSANQAITSDAGLYLRDITSSGYGMTLRDTSGSNPKDVAGDIGEYITGEPVRLMGSGGSTSLKLAIEETPDFEYPEKEDAVAFKPRWYGDTGELQSTFDSGHATVYFPSAAYFSYNQATVTVPDGVQHVVGFASIMNGSSTGVHGGGLSLVVNGDSSEPLIVEEFGYGIHIEHHGTRPVVLKDGKYTYTSYPGAGNLFLEDVLLQKTTFQAGQKIWARQLDDEVSGLKITNGGSLWILGLKTEQAGTVVQTEAGGKTELLGALIYPAQQVPAGDITFQSTDASVSYVYRESVYCAACGYKTQVRETKDGVTRSLSDNANLDFVMPLFVGH